MRIEQVNFSDPQAPATFSRSLRETGFGVVSQHPISKSLVDEVYALWSEFFSSDSKFDFRFDPRRQDGYFPFGSENAKGNAQKDLKEFYHIYPNGRLPEATREKTMQLYDGLLSLGTTLLRWIEEHSPEDIRDTYSEPLDQMIKGSQQNLFRIIHYPPLKGDEPEGSIRAAAHEDINLITLLPASTAMGLQVKDTQGQWHDIPGGYGDIVVNVGDMLQMASQNYFRSTTHRVVNPSGELAKSSRYSMPLFVHPRPDVYLSENTTAEDYLNQRLREIGLKA